MGTDFLLSEEVQDYWRGMHDRLERITPDIERINLDKSVTPEQYDPSKATEPKPPLVELVSMLPSSVEALRSAHDAMVNISHTLGPSLPYTRGTRGIVTTAGGSYFGMVIVSLRMLRRSGSRLPVVVFLDTEADYDAYVCEEVFLGLNAECVVLADLRAVSTPGGFTLERFQYKIFSILLAPFQEVMFLDADAFPAHNADGLFDTDPYASTGLVAWPDFWISTASPLLYDIVRMKPPPPAVRLERRTSESGILIYDKDRHAKDLLLALFYNCLGPGWFYPLISQGAEGEGDKDTFLLAAAVLGEPFYDVKSPVRVIGRWLNETWYTAGMQQADPREDWELNGACAPGNKRNEKMAKPLFIHNNIMKLDIERLTHPDNPVLQTNQTGHLVRLWGPRDDLVRSYGYDVEEVLWREIIDATCNLMSMRDCHRVMDVAEKILGKRITPPDAWRKYH
ncbi:mannosyltransferase putative-domain-containing protein [Xylariales sp. PMI_506]|nr:mannosyltransferase putative-domain-containing protein [Xylariales sp. PMI_506]